MVLMFNFGSTSLIDTSQNSGMYISAKNDNFGYFDVIDGQTITHQIFKNGDKIIGEYMECEPFALENYMRQLGVFVTKSYYVSGRRIIEGISKMLPYKNKNQNFNIQISVSEVVAKIGSPALLDSF